MFHFKKEKEYIEYEGTRCPYCSSRSIGPSGSNNRRKNRLYFGMSCDSCQHEWWDVFVLNSINDSLPIKNSEKVA